MNIKDMLFAEAMGLGGGGSALEPVVYTATGWNELPYIDTSEFFPASQTRYHNVLGFLSFSFSGRTVVLPVMISTYQGTYKQIAGGTSDAAGTGATISLLYDTVDEEWNVSKAWTNLAGSWTDITSAVQVGAADIELVLFK